MTALRLGRFGRAPHKTYGRVVGDETDEKRHAFNHVAAGHFLDPAIGAFDRHRRPYALDQFEPRVFVDHDDKIDGFECGQHFRAASRRIDRSAFKRDSTPGKLFVDTKRPLSVSFA